MKYAVILTIGGLCLCVLVLFVLPYFEPSEPEVFPPSESELLPIDEEEKQQARRETMKQLFERLETLRRQLKKQLRKIKFRLRNVTLVAEEAKTTQHTLKNAYQLLRNPKLLGAFSTPREIQNEIDNMTVSLAELEEITALIKAKAE